ncbi:MAG: putative collagen-binding domain-containing protein [Limisphaerales bacterium]
MTWREALDLLGARQMKHVSTMMHARPFEQLRPDQSLLVRPQPADPAHKPQAFLAARGDRFACIYSPEEEVIEVRTEQLSAGSIRASWFDPRTGAFTEISVVDAGPSQRFQPPSAGPDADWLLLLEAK